MIMVTGHGTVETAVEAMRLGAYDYLTKPFELPDLKRTIQAALGKKGAGTQSTNTIVDAPIPASSKLIGKSSVITRILSIVNRVADSDSTVLLEGEFGVGKHMIARALHEASRRSNAPFKDLQCSALPEELLEAELFGHGNPQSSLFARAFGGTVHLAEIHQMPMRIQAQLNSFLDQALSGPRGFNGTGMNFRLVTSSTEPLEEATREGKFREDLYYKISVVPMVVPPLRERREDIPLLVEHFLREQALRAGTGIMKKMEAYASEFLEKYSWPGNISELRNTVERACAMAEGDHIHPTDLPGKVTQKVEAPLDPANTGGATQRLPIGTTLDDFIRGQEKLFINETLKYNNGSREKTASMLGVSKRRKTHYILRNKEPLQLFSKRTHSLVRPFHFGNFTSIFNTQILVWDGIASPRIPRCQSMSLAAVSLSGCKTRSSRTARDPNREDSISNSAAFLSRALHRISIRSRSASLDLTPFFLGR